MRDGDNIPHKLPRVDNEASMEFNLANAPVTPSSMPPPPSVTPLQVAEPHMWGSLMALPEDVDGVVLAARVKQLLTSITMTAFVRVSPKDDQVPPFEPRFARQAVASFLHEHLMADDLTSVVLGTIKSGAARPITLAEHPVSDGQIYAVDFNLNLASAVNSQFIKNMLANLDATLNSPLSPDQQHLWFKFVPEDATHTFSLLLMPSIRADQSGLIAFSTLTPAQVRKDVCQFLQVPNLAQLPVAVYARATGTEIISLEPGLLARVIKGVSHLGTPANSGANYTLCKPIRELPAIVTNRFRSAANSPSQVANTSPGNQIDTDPNPPYLPADQFNPMPRAAMRPLADPFQPGPHRALTFRSPRGSPGDIITTVALFLAASFRSWLADDSDATTYDYWMPRILVKLRMNKPIRVVIAVTYGRLFAGVYEALQGTVLERLDRYTQIVLSAGLCLSTICLGGTFCNKCGKPGHIGKDCPQSPATPRNEITYRCPLCGELAGPGKGHEWDSCNKAKKIQMGAPSAMTCGICGHPEHPTPQCPSIYDDQLQEVILLPKMKKELASAGWTIGTDSQSVTQGGAVQSATATPTRTMPPASNVISPSSSSSSALSQVDTTSALSVSASALAVAEATNAIVMADLQDNLIRKLQLELSVALQPLRNELGEVRQAVAEQGKNVNTLAEVVGQNTTFMLKVSAANKRTGLQIAALRDQLNRELNLAHRPEDQVSAVSQEDLFHDSEEYDPAFPTDTRIGEPSPPGLESPEIGMQP
jgi:hypothetical protein